MITKHRWSSQVVARSSCSDDGVMMSVMVMMMMMMMMMMMATVMVSTIHIWADQQLSFLGRLAPPLALEQPVRQTIHSAAHSTELPLIDHTHALLVLLLLLLQLLLQLLLFLTPDANCKSFWLAILLPDYSIIQ